MLSPQLSTLVCIVACIISLLYYLTLPDRGVCPAGFNIPTASFLSELSLSTQDTPYAECFFPKDYDHSVATFRAMGLKAGADMKSMEVRAGDEVLHTLVAILRGQDEKHFLVHVSGTHGVEAYVGSAIQNAALQYFAQSGLYSANGSRAGLPTIVFVHSLNPFGFKHNRRVNEDNVDLNRNFLTDEEWQHVRSLDPNYARHVELDPVINRKSNPFRSIMLLNELYSWIVTGMYSLQYDTHTIKTALVAGNYLNPTGYGYGGQRWTASVRNLHRLLVEDLNLPVVAEKLVMIDVHSGLGPSGVDTLILDPSLQSDSEYNAAVELIFPTEYDLSDPTATYGGLKIAAGPADRISSTSAQEVIRGYELTKGMLTSSFCSQLVAPLLTSTNKICVAQEFGTLPQIFVGSNAINENYAHHYGSDAEKAYYKTKLKATFYVETKRWKRQTVHRGMMLILQAMKHLS